MNQTEKKSEILQMLRVRSLLRLKILVFHFNEFEELSFKIQNIFCLVFLFEEGSKVLNHAIYATCPPRLTYTSMSFFEVLVHR